MPYFFMFNLTPRCLTLRYHFSPFEQLPLSCFLRSLAYSLLGLVLLIVIVACLARHFSSSKTTPNATVPNEPATPKLFPEKFQAVYIVSQDPFPEIDSFVASSSAEYHLEVARYTLPMRKGLESYLADRPSIQAVFVGTRRTDPHGENLKPFDPTDAGWPPFMRVHPVLDWHYGT